MSNGPPRIFDPDLYRWRRKRAAQADGDIFLAEDAGHHIAERLTTVNRTFARGLDLHSRTRIFPLLSSFAKEWVRTGTAADHPDIITIDDALPFGDASFDLVTSVLSLHAVNDLPGTLLQIRRVLKPDGLFIAALFAGETLSELRLAFAAAETETTGGASPRIAPFADVRDLGGLLQRTGFTLIVTDVERTIVRYRDLTKLFADIRALGESNALAGRRVAFLRRSTLRALITEYAGRFGSKDGRLTATFDIAFLTGWSPHENQPKPLRPGSAKVRLADALGTAERPAGEKTGMAKPSRK